MIKTWLISVNTSCFIKKLKLLSIAVHMYNIKVSVITWGIAVTRAVYPNILSVAIFPTDFFSYIHLPKCPVVKDFSSRMVFRKHCLINYYSLLAIVVHNNCNIHRLLLALTSSITCLSCRYCFMILLWITVHMYIHTFVWFHY